MQTYSYNYCLLHDFWNKKANGLIISKHNGITIDMANILTSLSDAELINQSI